MKSTSPPAHNSIFWDGDCRFCRNCVRLMARIDRAGFVFLPYQAVPEKERKKWRLTDRRCQRELQLLTSNGRVFSGIFAINYFLFLQPRWRAVVLISCALPLLFLVELLAYRSIARNRGFFNRVFFPRDKK